MGKENSITLNDRERQLLALKEYVTSLAGNNPNGKIEFVGVNVEGTGADKTRHRLLKAHALPLLAATTVDEVVAAANSVQTSLNSLDIYQDVMLSIDSPRPGQLTALINLPSAKRFLAQTGTSFGNGEGSGYIRCTAKNHFGLGEIFTVDTSVGTRTKSATLFQASAPLAGVLPLRWRAELLAYGAEKSVDWASHREQVRGATIRITSPKHTFGLDYVLRSLYASKVRPSATVRSQAGHATKYSAFYNWNYDSRNNAFLPTSGALVKVCNEVAAGDYPYLKTCVDFVRGFRISEKISMSISGRCGGLIPLNGQSHISDRFFLGGPLDVRGFRISRLGRNDEGDAVGGDAVMAGGLSLYAPVPRVSSPNLRLHAFINGGSVRPYSQGVLQTFSDMLSTPPSIATGFGLVYAHPAARFELNLTFPLTSHAGEQSHKGLQFGVGLSFL